MDTIGKYFCSHVLPLVYDDSLSYYELLNKCVKYINGAIEDIETLQAEIDPDDSSVVVRWRGEYSGPWVKESANAVDFGKRGGIWLIKRPSASADQTNWPASRYFSTYALLLIDQIQEPVTHKATATLVTDSGRIYTSTLSSTYTWSDWRSDENLLKPGDNLNSEFVSMTGYRYGPTNNLYLYYPLPKEVASNTDISVGLIGDIITPVGRIHWSSSSHEIASVAHAKYSVRFTLKNKDNSAWTVDDTPVPEYAPVSFNGYASFTFSEHEA